MFDAALQEYFYANATPVYSYNKVERKPPLSLELSEAF